MGRKNKAGFRSEHLGGGWDEPGGEEVWGGDKRRGKVVWQNQKGNKPPQVWQQLQVPQQTPQPSRRVREWPR